jgi:ribonuclease P protein component
VVRLRSGFARTEFVSAVSDQLMEAVRHEIQTLMQAGAKAA